MASIAWFKKMVAIFGNTVANGTVTNAKLGALAVDAAKLASNAVETAKIKDVNVTTAKIANLAITTGKLDDLAVTEDKLAADAVTTDKIANGAVTSAKLADVLGTAAIADGAVTNAKIAAGANIAQSKLALTNGQIPIGDVTNIAVARAITGDVTINNAGVATIGAGVVIDADINAAADIAFSKLAALADGNILVGSDQDVATSIAVSGDATLDNAGKLTIEDEAVTSAKIADDAGILLTQMEAIGVAKIIVGAADTGIATAVDMSGEVVIDNLGATTIADDAVTSAKIADAAGILATQLEALGVGEIIVGSAQGNDKVTLSGDAVMDGTGDVLLNAAIKEQIIQVHVPNLAVGDDIADLPVYVHPRANTLQSIGILTQGTPVGIDADSPVVITIKNDNGDTIVAETYNAANPAPDKDYADLGALSGDHKVLAADEHITLSVDQGDTADMPAFLLVIVTVPANAA